VDTLLVLIGVLGLGALVIAAYVFASAARRYVTGQTANDMAKAHASDLSPYRARTARSGDRRRNTEPVVFPLVIDGELVPRDRRRGERRRQFSI